MKLFSVLLVTLAFSLMSFNSRIKKDEILYTYLEYKWDDYKTKTVHVFVSDVLPYQDWKENSIALRNKFISKAAEQSQIEIWSAGIEPKYYDKSVEQVKIKRQNDLNSSTRWEESYGRSVKIYYVSLYRL